MNKIDMVAEAIRARYLATHQPYRDEEVDWEPLSDERKDKWREMAHAAMVEILDELVCKKCGCTDGMACPGGCFWVTGELCSACDPDNKNRTVPA